MARLLHRLRARVRNKGFDDELLEELRLHEAMKREELEAGGMTPNDARAAARRALGNVTLMREESRRVWIAPWLESVVQDARYGVRMLARQPLHSLTAIAVLVLAIGLSTSFLTILKATTFAPWPVHDADRIVRIRAMSGHEWVGPSIDEYRFVREHTTTLAGVAAHYHPLGMPLRSEGRGETQAKVELVSSNFLDVLGARLHLGSGFVVEDDLPGLGRAPAVISHELWRSFFGEDPNAVGAHITIRGRPFTVVGVLDPQVDGLGRPVGVWLPLSAIAAMGWVTPVGVDSAGSAHCCVHMIGRLKAHVDREDARREVQSLHQRFTSARQKKAGVAQVFGTAYADTPGAGDLELLPVVGAALLLVLVLACANVGNLQLARGLSRRREIATRVAIGAARARIVRQLIVEGLVLAAIAGLISVALAAVAPAYLLAAIGDNVPPTRGDWFTPDWRVMALTGAICVLACLTFALAPALHATRRTIPLGSLDRGATRRARLHLRSGFLAVQITVCTVLLIGAGLVTRAIAHAMTFDPGFPVNALQRANVSLPPDTPAAEQQELVRRVLLALERDLPDPIAVSSPGPIVDFPYTIGIALPHESPAQYRPVARRSVSRRYFDVLGVPLVRGRIFASDATGEVVVNEAFVRAFWPGEEVLGRVLREIDRQGQIARSHTVVGVVRDAYLTGFERVEPVVFRPTTVGMFLIGSDPATLARIRSTATAVNALASVRVWPLSEDVGERLEQSRVGAAVAWGFGLLALALASVGVLGVFAYAVEERRREIGVRRALGAGGAHIMRTLVTTSGRGMLLGLGAGLLLSLGCGPVLRSYLYGLHPLDPIAYGGVMALLAATAALATLVPARRACRVDPAVTLREQ